MTRIVALVCIALVVLTPLQVMAADGATQPELPVHPFSVETEVVTTSPFAPIHAYGVFTSGDQPGDMTAYIATADRSVNVRRANGVIFTDDGYSIVPRLLRNDDDEVVIQIIARGPDGLAAQAMLRGQKRTGAVEKTGVRDVQALLSRSTQFSLVQSTVPHFTQASPQRGKLRVATNSCMGSVIAMFGASLTVIAACGEVEMTGDLMGCIGAIIALAGTLVSVYETCGQPDLCGDAPCPTPEEPPCTSLTIC